MANVFLNHDTLSSLGQFPVSAFGVDAEVNAPPITRDICRDAKPRTRVPDVYQEILHHTYGSSGHSDSSDH